MDFENPYIHGHSMAAFESEFTFLYFLTRIQMKFLERRKFLNVRASPSFLYHIFRFDWSKIDDVNLNDPERRVV